MRWLGLVSLLAVRAAADSSAGTSSSSAAGAEDPTPVGALWTSTWTPSSLAPYTQSCRTRTSHRGTLYKLSQLYPDLEIFAPQLKVFYNQQAYPGSWSGIDKHGNERELIKMEMSELPWKVREWIKREKTQRHYSVHDDVVFFAPGAVYPILPLWVEGEEKGCEGVFDGLEPYSNEPKDGSVIGKVSHVQDGEEVEFTVEALRVALQAGGERSEL
ncbi:hypothetical protein EKO04_010205 [Ascochyta lentis]|uniref:Uncharacterized protein n=1 Tax=Ascochyta lentis TaxID=205686 RepID=A0A8H7IV97_9PLEO|nr:hypothetical protein EKO04_010205 [Ascochyta lentis]